MSQTPQASESAAQPSQPRPLPEKPSAVEVLPLTAAEDRRWATMAHFGGVLLCLPSLVIFLLFRHRGPFTAQESKEALNFTLPPTILALICAALSFLPNLGGLFAVLHALIWVGVTIFSLFAGVEVERGRPYRYDLNLRLIK